MTSPSSAKLFKKAPLTPIIKLQELKGWTNSEVSEALGYSATALNGWLAQDEAPLVANKLATMMLKEKGLKSSLYVMLVPEDKREMCNLFMSSIGVELKEVL